ncbi:hypothetical protein ACFV9W_31860 [Streptomyces sp. NPDC059897]|uniref:hypothetical protein n=1 Tax=Streptomyces sp. NPDC059897 TaxID=3346994 RepID=UPI00366494AA
MSVTSYPDLPSPATKPRGKARTFFGIALITCAAIGLLLTLAFGWTIFFDRATTRNPAYEATAWRNESADEVFPDTLAAYAEDPDDTERQMKWVRAGIAQETSCAAGLEGPALKLANARDCQAVFRATYVDALNTQVASVGLIVLGDTKKDTYGTRPNQPLAEAITQYGDGDEGAGEAKGTAFSVRAHSVKGTPAAAWSDARRNSTVASDSSDNYVFAVTTGSTDGRMAARLPAPWNSYGVNAAHGQDRTAYSEAAKGLSKAAFMSGLHEDDDE